MNKSLWTLYQNLNESGMNAADRDQIAELLAMPELQAGFQTLAENLPGFQSFVDTMLPADSTEASTTTEAAGMVRHILPIFILRRYIIYNIFFVISHKVCDII